MPRRGKHPQHENHERWLVSYADFITLLFAFFVVMFASSQTDKGKAQQMSHAVRQALENGTFGSAVAGILGGTPDDKGKGSAQMKGPGGQEHLSRAKRDEKPIAAELGPTRDQLQELLKDELRLGKMQLTLEKRGLVVSFQQATFFPSGTDEIPAETYESIRKVGTAIQPLPNPIRCEGHTDALPLRNSARFQSNWELSAARAIAMMEMLVYCCNVPRERFSIAGYAENAPTSDNSSEEGRRRNRRVDIVILSPEGMSAEPTAAAHRVALPAVPPKSGH
jgi:chemotaxis protein MotB